MMEFERTYYGHIDLMEFLGHSQYGECLDVYFESERLSFYPEEVIIDALFHSDFEDGESMGYDEITKEIRFSKENPFTSEELRFENDEYIIKNYDDLYPIIKAMNVYNGLIDDDYDDHIILSDGFRFDGFRIQVEMDYLDGKYSIREVHIIKDLQKEEDSS